jgi:restriction endonuclease Mrr
MDFYRPLILKALAEMGGQGRAKEVLRRVFEMAEPYLSDKDLEPVPSGTSKRWEKRANWERYRMVQEGLLRSDSPQGIWELSEKGWEEAKRLLEQ